MGSPVNMITMSVEIALPDEDEEVQDAIVDDLSHEENLLRLRKTIAQWARLISGSSVHVEVTVD